MITDYHCHLLPGIDDGSPDSETSRRMIRVLREQGVGRVAATPHFIRHRWDSPNDFLERRSLSLSALEGAENVQILPGAEVYLEQGLSELDSLEKLVIGDSRHIMLEMHLSAFKSWMANEIHNVMYRFKLTPILAHLERYLRLFGKDGIREILSMRGIVIQINNEALYRRSTRSFALELIRGGFPVVFGSDAHNMDLRPPDFDRAHKILRAKLTKSELFALMELNENLL